jgi:hypothetical protein
MGEGSLSGMNFGSARDVARYGRKIKREGGVTPIRQQRRAGQIRRSLTRGTP